MRGNKRANQHSWKGAHLASDKPLSILEFVGNKTSIRMSAELRERSRIVPQTRARA